MRRANSLTSSPSRALPSSARRDESLDVVRRATAGARPSPGCRRRADFRGGAGASLSGSTLGPRPGVSMRASSRSTAVGPVRALWSFEMASSRARRCSSCAFTPSWFFDRVLRLGRSASVELGVLAALRGELLVLVAVEDEEGDHLEGNEQHDDDEPRAGSPSLCSARRFCGSRLMRITSASPYLCGARARARPQSCAARVCKSAAITSLASTVMLLRRRPDLDRDARASLDGLRRATAGWTSRR